MSVETISSLVNLGAAGAVIIIVVVFLNFLRDRDKAYEERNKMQQEFFERITASSDTRSVAVEKALDTMISISKSVDKRLESLENAIYLHDIRVDKIVEKIEKPGTEAPSMLPKRRKTNEQR